MHAEADRLEHALSEELEARIDEMLGSPTEDPHGDPIPDARLRVVHSKARPLTELEPGEHATVLRVPDGDDECCAISRHLRSFPGQRVELVAAAPFDGPVTLATDGREASISRQLAAQIQVSL